MQLAGDRLCFQRISGEGPDTGWAAGQRGQRADGEEKRGDDFGDMSDFINRDWIEKMISKQQKIGDGSNTITIVWPHVFLG